MKLAIIADVHSNGPALEAVLAEIDGLGADALVCAGDTVGYGASPNDCCARIKSRADKTVLGNHDASSLTRDTSFMNPYAAKAVLWTASALNDESRRWLKDLDIGDRLEIGNARCAIYHGSIDSNTEYVYEDDAKESMLSRTRSNLLILGHTHVPYIKRFKTGMIVNPGSVGQPRDGDPRASFATVDASSMDCTIVRLDYDIDAAAGAIDAAGLPGFLAERLYSGR